MGWAVGSCERQQVKALGGVCERWRFKDPLSAKARLHTLHDPDSVLPHLHEEFLQNKDVFTSRSADFEGVPFEIVDRKWHVCGRHKWKKSSSMPVNEARASLYAAKHILRSCEGFSQRHVILSDSMTSTCAFSRGRAHTHELRRVCQQFGALCFASGAQITVRWIPSEWNPSDGPSRGRWTATVPTQYPDHGAAPEHPGGRASEDVQQGDENSKKKFTQGREEFHYFSDSGMLERALRPCAGDNSYEPAQAKGGATDSEGKEKGHHRGKAVSSPPGICFKAEPKQIYSALARIEAPGDEQKGKAEISARGGQADVRTARGEVPGWGGCQLSQLSDSIPHVLQSQFAVARDDQLTSLQAVNEGVAQFVSYPKPIANSLGGDSSPGGRLLGPEPPLHGASYAADVCVIPSTNRSSADQEDGRSASNTEGWDRVPMLVHCPPPPGMWETVQDQGIRREFDVGLGVSQGDWPGPLQVQPADGQDQNHPEAHPWRASDLPAASPGETGPWAARCATPLPFQAWWSKSRFCPQVAGSSGHSTARALAVSSQRPSIPEGSSPVTGVWNAQCRNAKPLHRIRKKSAKTSCHPALSVPGSLQEVVFIEIFSGSGRLGKTVSRELNIPVLLWDICLGPSYDLRSRRNRTLIIGWLRSKRIAGGHLGTPCNSFTRARDHPPGPPPLRSNLHVLGLPGLSPADQAKVSDSNLFMRFSMQLLVVALQIVVPFTCENPATSRLWLCPQVQYVLRRKCAQTWTAEFCMFGAPWRKPTTFLAVYLSLEPLEPFRCLGAKRGLCKRTSCHHLLLSGTNSKGQWLTKIAEPYPWKLCNKLARCFSNFYAQKRAEQFEAAMAR